MSTNIFIIHEKSSYYVCGKKIFSQKFTCLKNEAMLSNMLSPVKRINLPMRRLPPYSRQWCWALLTVGEQHFLLPKTTSQPNNRWTLQLNDHQLKNPIRVRSDHDSFTKFTTLTGCSPMAFWSTTIEWTTTTASSAWDNTFASYYSTVPGRSRPTAYERVCVYVGWP